jgi:orf117b gp
MKLEYSSKSLEYDGSGVASATKVTLVNSTGANVPVFLPADKIDLSNTELFDLALESLYQENFPQRAENERFSKVDQELQKNKEAAAQAEQAVTETKENLDTVSAITEVLIALAISQNGGMPTHTYNKVASFVKPLVKSTRYNNGDIVAMPYPFDTNAKWPKGTQTIFKFQMQQSEGYTYKEQDIADMLRQGVLTVVMPRIE